MKGGSWAKVSRIIIFIVGEREKRKSRKRKASRRMESEKNMRSKGDIWNKSGWRDARNPFSPSHRTLLLSSFLFIRFFSGACSSGNTHADTWRRHAKKIAYNCTIFLSIAIFLPSSPLFSRTVHGALPITTYIVFSNNGKILRPHRHFHPLCHLIGAFFKGKTKLPARLLMVANDRRVSIRDQAFYFHQWIQLSIILYSLFFSSLDTQFTDIVYYSSINKNRFILT